MKILSLFDGISCGMLALQRAGIPVEEYHAFEIDKYAIRISENNFPEIIRHSDVFDGDFAQFQGFDMLIGGSPCTYWSVAKSGRETTANGEGFRLFMQYARALDESKCRYFLYENNYSIHQNIKREITKTLGVEPIMINSALVSAQQRKRCYWTNIPNVTQPADKNILLKDIIESGTAFQQKSYCIKSCYHPTFRHTLERHANTMVAEPVRIGEYGRGGRAYRIYSVHGKSVTICGSCGGGGMKTGLYKIDLPDGDYIVRKLTPVECERLQTLPDNYTAGVSDTQRYKCIGNGWTVDVIAHILHKLNELEE